MTKAQEFAEQILREPEVWEEEVVLLAKEVRALSARTSELRAHLFLVRERFEFLAAHTAAMIAGSLTYFGLSEQQIEEQVPLSTQKRVITWVAERVPAKKEEAK